MEVDDIQMQRCKFARIENGKKNDLNKTGKEEEDGGGSGGGGRFFGWPASRIVRVSKASGGKDRHSKVWTSKGLRDRRVRLSVTTAIQFYDLQDRLGYDQPSKAVEWLIKAAADAIDDLPTINTSFPGTPKQLSDGKRPSQEIDSLEHGLDQQQKLSASKSACSSNSETNSGNLSLSRTKSRDKARERAKERLIEREKERVNESVVAGHQEMNPISQSSFTDLLSGCISNVNSYTHFFKKPQTWSSSAPMDYFTPVSSMSHQSSGFSDQIQMGNSMPFSVTGDQFSFVPEHLAPVTTSGDNLNFTISSGYAGFSRGTLQSNSPSLFSNDQRISSIDRSNMPFFIGNTGSSPASLENQHQFSAGIDGPLQLYYGNGGRNSDKEGDKY